MLIAFASQGQAIGKKAMLKELLVSAARSVVTASAFGVNRTQVKIVAPVPGRPSVLSHSISGRHATIRKRLAGNSTQLFAALLRR